MEPVAAPPNGAEPVAGAPKGGEGVVEAPNGAGAAPNGVESAPNGFVEEAAKVGGAEGAESKGLAPKGFAGVVEGAWRGAKGSPGLVAVGRGTKGSPGARGGRVPRRRRELLSNSIFCLVGGEEGSLAEIGPNFCLKRIVKEDDAGNVSLVVNGVKFIAYSLAN